MAALGHSGLPQWKGRLCTLCKKKKGFTNEYRMYNRERARPLFVWNVDNGSQGAVWPPFFCNCWRTQKLQELQTGWEPESHSSVLAPHGNPVRRPALFPEFSLGGGLRWTARELRVLFLLNDLLFWGRRLTADSRVLQRKCAKQTFSPMRAILSNHIQHWTRNGGIWSPRKQLCLFLLPFMFTSLLICLACEGRVQLKGVGSVCLAAQLLPPLKRRLCAALPPPVTKPSTWERRF